MPEVFDKYMQFVLDTAQSETGLDLMVLAGLGISGEAGEVTDLVKKEYFHGKDIEDDEYLLEIGDTIWYAVLGLALKGYTLEECLQANVNKLNARYPGRSEITTLG